MKIALVFTKLLTLLLLAIAIGACANKVVEPTGLRFNSVEILNLSSRDIYNVKIEVTKFHRKFMCGIILHRSMCMNGFSERRLQENDIEITWEQYGRQYRVGPFKISTPENYDPNTVYSATFVFTEKRVFEVQFKPSSY